MLNIVLVGKEICEIAIEVANATDMGSEVDSRSWASESAERKSILVEEGSRLKKHLTMYGLTMTISKNSRSDGLIARVDNAIFP